MIFLLHGPDSFRRQQKLQELKDKFINSLDPLGQSLSVIDGEKISIKELSSQINSGSLFSKKRMIVINNIFINKNKELFNYVLDLSQKTQDPENNIIIFNEETIYKTKLNSEAKKLATWLLKQPYVQEFKILNNLQLLQFAKKEIQSKKAQIQPSALTLLVSKTGDDLWRLHNEINKLIAASSNQAITEKLVNELVKGEIEENIFNLIDALVSKNKNLAIKLLEEQLLAGLSVEYILAMLQRQVKIMLSVKLLQEEGVRTEQEAAQKLSIHPFVAKKAWQQSKNFSLEELSENWQKLLGVDLENKSGKTNVKSELYLLLTQDLN